MKLRIVRSTIILSGISVLPMPIASSIGWIIENNNFTAADSRMGIRVTGGGQHLEGNNTMTHWSSRLSRTHELITVEATRQSIVECNDLAGPFSQSQGEDARGVFIAAGTDNSLSCNTLYGQSFNINI
jgi:hypothetical protein